MELSLNQPYRLTLMDRQTELTVPQLLIQALEVQIIRNYPNGMDKTGARLWGRIDDKLWASLEATEQDGGGCIVAFDDSEHDFLRRELDKAVGIPPQNARAIRLWQDIVTEEKPSAGSSDAGLDRAI